MQALSITSGFWIGLRRHGSLWLWVNGEYAAPAAIYWHQTEPDNFNGNEDCAFILVYNKWNNERTTHDISCYWHQAFALCEKIYSQNN